MCRHYDRSVAEQCRNDDAEYVKEKERPNFCDFFSPGEGAYQSDGGQADTARRELDALFGGDGGSQEPDDPAADLDALFRKD